MKKRNFTRLFLITVFCLGIHSVVQSQSPNPPEVLPEAPIHDQSDVLSIYSDVYTNDPSAAFTFHGTDAIVDALVMGDNMLAVKIGEGSVPCYLEFDTPLNLEDYNTLCMDVYAVEQNRFNLRIRLEGNSAYQLTFSIATGWNKLEIDLNDFLMLASPPDLSAVGQINLVGEYARSIYIDNIYASKTLLSIYDDFPTVPAPVPTQSVDNVLPIFTDAYPNEIGVKINAQTVGNPKAIKGVRFSQGPIDKMIYVKDGKTGNGGLDFNTAVDISDYDSLHFDVYPIKSGLPMRVLIGGVATAGGVYMRADNVNTWNSMDVSLEDFLENATSTPDFTNVKDRGFWVFQATGYERTFILDNIFFYKKGLSTNVNDVVESNIIKTTSVGTKVLLESDIKISLIEVFSLSGAHIQSVQDTGRKIEVDLQNESNGIYLFTITLDNGESVTKKILRI